jgi:hypothetical protein
LSPSASGPGAPDSAMNAAMQNDRTTDLIAHSKLNGPRPRKS